MSSNPITATEPLTGHRRRNLTLKCLSLIVSCINCSIKLYVKFKKKLYSFGCYSTIRFYLLRKTTIKYFLNLFLSSTDLDCVCMLLRRGSGWRWRRGKAGRHIQPLCWRKSNRPRCEIQSWSQVGKWAARRLASVTRTTSETPQSLPWPKFLQLQSETVIYMYQISYFIILPHHY